MPALDVGSAGSSWGPWFLDWPNDYDTAQSAESLCAASQILLADLRKEELSLLPSDVHLRVEMHDGEFNIPEVPDNEKVALVVRLPSKSSGIWDPLAIAVGVAAATLRMVSALPDDKFLATCESRFRAGLGAKLSPYAEYYRLFREFHSREEFENHYEHSRKISLTIPRSRNENEFRSVWSDGLHPEYSAAESRG